MRQLRPDLWETEPDAPAPGLTTHAYLWIPPGGGNVLFYSTAGSSDLGEIERLGGVAHQYLSHHDEVSPALRTFHEGFGATLHVPAREAGAVAEVRQPDVLFDTRHLDDCRVEVIPTPGHSPGSTSFLVTGHDGRLYLFTGDTLLRGADGRWFAGFIPGVSDAEDLAASLAVLAELEPDLVVSSAFTGDAGAHAIDRRTWPDAVAQALAGLPQRERQRS